MSGSTLKQAPVVLCHLLSPFSDKATVESLLKRLNQNEPLSDRVIELANRNFLIPTLFHQLDSHRLTSLLKPDLLEYMQAMADFMEERNTQLTRQLSEVVKILNENEITPLIMKGGAVLFSDLYPDKKSRFMIDLDLLLPVGEVSAAKEILEGQGYATIEKYRDKIVTSENQHIPPLHRDGEPCTVEIHLKPLRTKYQHFLSGKECFQHARRISELSGQGLNALRMSPEHLVIHCFVHSELADKNHESGILELRQLDYFVRLLHHYQESLDWEYCASKITTEYDQFAFDLYLYKANQLFGAPIPLLSGSSEKQKLASSYQDALKSCYPQEHLGWGTNQTVNWLFNIFGEHDLKKTFEINDKKDLWVARKKRLVGLLKKHNNPSKILRRIIDVSRRFS